jgi:hypothetical protein
MVRRVSDFLVMACIIPWGKPHKAVAVLVKVVWILEWIVEERR